MTERFCSPEAAKAAAIIEEWAAAHIGVTLRHQYGPPGVVVGWSLGDRGRGVWFTFEDQRQVYRALPVRFKNAESGAERK